MARLGNSSLRKLLRFLRRITLGRGLSSEHLKLYSMLVFYGTGAPIIGPVHEANLPTSLFACSSLVRYGMRLLGRKEGREGHLPAGDLGAGRGEVQGGRPVPGVSQSPPAGITGGQEQWPPRLRLFYPDTRKTLQEFISFCSIAPVLP